jgi:hypothetical protein
MSFPLIEPMPIEDEFCSGLARIEDVGGCARFVLYSEQTLFEAGERTVWVVRKKIVLPIQAIKPGVEMTLGYLARQAVTAAGDRLLRTVKG